MPRDWRGLWLGPGRAEEESICGRAPIGEGCMTLTVGQSGKASWKRGQPWSQVVKDLEGVGRHLC